MKKLTILLSTILLAACGHGDDSSTSITTSTCPEGAEVYITAQSNWGQSYTSVGANLAEAYIFKAKAITDSIYNLQLILETNGDPTVYELNVGLTSQTNILKPGTYTKNDFSEIFVQAVKDSVLFFSSTALGDSIHNFSLTINEIGNTVAASSKINYKLAKGSFSGTLENYNKDVLTISGSFCVDKK